jgi:two-component system aerobic respiration control sensor histidine kinase ArcB
MLGMDLKISQDHIVNFLPARVYWMNKDMVFSGCNELQAKSIGLSSPAEIIGKTVYDFQSKENAESIIRNNHLVLNTKKTIAFEEIAWLPDGSRGVYLSQKSPLFDQEGNVIGLLGISFDITEKKQKEENKDILLEEIISNLPGNVYWKNREGVYLGCNTNLAKMINLSSSKEVMGKTLDQIFPDAPDVAKNISEEDEKIMQENRPRSFEENGLNLNRQPAVYLTSKVPLHDAQGEVIGLLGLSFDITERKTLEENLKEAKEKAETASALKSDFIRNMEHDIRTPVSGLFGITHMLAKQEKDEKKKEILEVVEKAAKELLDFTNSILEFSKIESEAIPILEKKFGLKQLVESVVALEMPPALNKNLKLELNYPKNMSTTLIGDAHRLKRMLINLVSNAVKFTNEGFVKLSVILAKQEDKKVILQFKIEDSGIGIPKEKQNFIYEKFMRGTPSNQGKYKGQGLGLRIVKQFIHEMEGEIDVKSEEGEGTTFVCTLPFKLPLIENALDGVLEEEYEN